MATILNADIVSGGAIITGDASGVLVLQGGGNTGITISAAGVPTVAAIKITTGAGALKLLTSDADGDATWEAPAVAANGLVWLSTVTASNSATVDVETTFSSTYDAYLLVISGLTVATNEVGIFARMKLSGAYVTTSTYRYHVQMQVSSGTTYVGDAVDPAAQIQIAYPAGNAASDSHDIVIKVFNPASTAFKKLIKIESVGFITSVTDAVYSSGGASNDGTGALTGIRIYASSGNILAGTFRLYGIANS